MTKTEIADALRMIAKIIDTSPRRMSGDGGCVKALIPVRLVSAIEAAADELETAE